MTGSTQLARGKEAHVRHRRESRPAVRDLIGGDIGADTRTELLRDERQKSAVARPVVQECSGWVAAGQRHRHVKSGGVTEGDDARLALQLLLGVVAKRNRSRLREEIVIAHGTHAWAIPAWASRRFRRGAETSVRTRARSVNARSRDHTRSTIARPSSA